MVNQRRLVDSSLPPIEIRSSGTSVNSSRAPSGNALAVLADRGIEVNNKQSGYLSDQRKAEADFIFCVNPGQRDEIVGNDDALANKVYPLRYFDLERGDDDGIR